MRWRPEQDECAECGFSWSISAEAAIHLVEQAPDRFASLLANNNGAPPDSAAGRWSATSYLWHTVDVIRFGTERLWTITLDAASGFQVGIRTLSPTSGAMTNSPWLWVYEHCGLRFGTG